MTYIIEVEEDDSGECFITLPDELLEELCWQEGDLLNWDLRGEGFLLTKVNDPENYEVLEE
jgi:hypothetical protein